VRRLFPPALILLSVGISHSQQAERPEEAVGANAGVDPAIVQSLDEAMKKLAQKRNADGVKASGESDFASALGFFQDAYELDPSNAEFAGNLGYAYYRLGSLKEAERLLREALILDPDRFATYLNLAEIMVREGEPIPRIEEAERLLARADELKDNNARVALYRARAASLSGKFEEAERFYERYIGRRDPSDKALLEIGDFYRSFGRSDQAMLYYRKIAGDGKSAKEALARIRGIEIANLAGQYQWSRGKEAIPPEAKLLTAKGRVLINQKKYAEAEELFSKVLSLAPGHTDARIGIGDLYQKTGRTSQAELAYLRALSLDAGNAEIYERLGKLYLTEQGKQGAREAALILSRALDLRPDWLDLHLILARALQSSGDLVGALSNVNQFVSQAVPASECMAEALELKQTLEQLIPAGSGAEDRPNAQAPWKKPDKNLARALSLARKHLARGEPGEALAELRSLPAEMKGPEVLNLEGRILFASKRLEEAAAVMEKSLAANPAQAEIHEQLGLILSKQGNVGDGRDHLLAAERIGSDTAAFYIARMDLKVDAEGLQLILADAGKIKSLMKSKERLDRFLERGRASVWGTEAIDLKNRVSRRTLNVFIAAASLLVLVVIAIVIVATKLFGGDRLSDLLDRYPQSGHDVQRVLSAIRHEVLKHNTMMLSGLVRAMEQTGDADSEAEYLPKSLIRSGGGFAIQKLDEYIEELVKIGRSYGMRLNLVRRDPAISILKSGFSELVPVPKCPFSTLTCRCGLYPRTQYRVATGFQSGRKARIYILVPEKPYFGMGTS
jgi:Flp pilus assembly protein TadD